MTKTQSKINNNSPSVERSANSIKNLNQNLNYVILIHTKSHQTNNFDAFTRLNHVADSKAKMLAKSLLANKIPRNTNHESEPENNHTPTNPISQSQVDNDEGHEERAVTAQTVDQRSHETNKLNNVFAPTDV